MAQIRSNSQSSTGKSEIMRAGFIGTGYFANEHAECLRRLGVEVAACFGTNQLKTKEFSNKFGALRFNSPLDMIDKKNIDVLFIVVPPFAHDGEVELAAIEKGIPFLGEKPIGLDLSKCRDIASRIEQKGLVTSSGYWLRAGNVSERIKRVISANQISLAQSFWLSGFIRAPWWGKMETSGGPLVEMVTHYIDYMRFMLGEIQSVTALSKHGVNSSRPNCDVYDSIVSLLLFSNGQIGSLNSSHILQDDVASKRILELTGREFYMCVETERVKYKQGAENWVALDFESNRMDINTQRFLEAVRRDDPAFVYGSYPDALKTLEVTMAISKSAEEKGCGWLT